MSNKDFSKKILGLQDVNITDITERDKEIEVYVTLEVKEHKRPCCNNSTSKIHDYRTQRITDIPYRAKKMTIVLRKRRYGHTNQGTVSVKT